LVAALNDYGFAWKTPHRIASLGCTYCLGLNVDTRNL